MGLVRCTYQIYLVQHRCVINSNKVMTFVECNNFNGTVYYWKVERLYRRTTEDSQMVQDFNIDSGESGLGNNRERDRNKKTLELSRNGLCQPVCYFCVGFLFQLT